MFRRNNPVSGLQTSDSTSQTTSHQSMTELPLRPAQAPSMSAPSAPQAASSVQPLSTRPVSMAPASAPGKAADLPNSRFGGIPGVLPRRVGAPEAGSPASSTGSEPGLRKLIVGREISMSGDITACDILMVEGNIEATLRDGKHLEITEDGHFKGSAEVDEADIAGKFEGSITVRGRLKLRATGRIDGTISYGEIEVEAGGRLVGELKILSATSQKRESEASVRMAVGAEG